MTDIEYRTDPPAWQEYFQLFSSTGWMPVLRVSEDDLKKVFDNTWYWITAYKDESIAGCGRLISDGVLYAFVCDIIVMPDHQNKGIGSTILKQLVNKCQETNLKRVWLFAAPDKAGFYEKHGFIARPGEAPGMQLGKFEYEK
ncbi:hypothetical protein SDC9_175975 [bioreactor metagenome]|uniref:N-acetyltransferase domain-containing protein n=1 Tax=bioreactor metagenome TaxID=1076179 RepID=A0A645GY24_9ZZZZ